jgi:hypothetical protein
VEHIQVMQFCAQVIHVMVQVRLQWVVVVSQIMRHLENPLQEFVRM